MHIVIAGHFGYPTGSAAASRIRHFARGLTECGHRVHVISMNLERPSAIAVSSADTWQEHDGVPYLHAAGAWTPQQRKSATRKLPALLAGWRRAQRVAKQHIGVLQDTEGVDAVIGYSNMGVGFHGLVRFCKRRRIPMIRDVVEWLGPESFLGGAKNPLYWNAELCFRWSVPQADGIIGISRFLTDHFAARGLPTVRIPAVIDPAVFDDLPPPTATDAAGPFRVTYLGNMNLRDGPTLMIDAIRQVVATGRDVCFDVIGNTDPIPAARQARARAESDPLLRHRVRFRGRLSDAEVASGLRESDALIFTRLSGRASQAAFPTRLPEYLVSGRPVIASDVSDIGEHLRDGVDVIMVAPDSADALAAGILRLLDAPDRGRSIGLSGKQRCRAVFDYAARSAEIAAFLATLVPQQTKTGVLEH